ncbi:MAG: Holliday junction resolvase RuvX [Bacteroidales bacterium]|nr:Holliday junction resolvase RuvX [Bacteroidales bacterium]
MGRILAIDYGQKRVGIAVTDVNRIIATALTTVHAKDTISFLKDYLGKEIVDFFVVGKPRQMNNQDSNSVKFVEPFVKKLRKEFPGIPVERYDERFTSVIAAQTIIQAGIRKKDRRDKSLVDKVSAVLILQSFMEYIKNKRGDLQ